MIDVPATFRTWMIQANGAPGAAWLDNVPATILEIANRWHLSDFGSIMHGGASLAIPVNWQGQPAMLKLAFPTSSNQYEAAALAHWNGRGLVRLLQHDPATGTMLLERLGPTSLDTVPWRIAIEEAGKLICMTAVEPLVGLPDVHTTAARIADTLWHRWQATGKPMSRRIMEVALANIAAHATDATHLMVNKDLHFKNVLQGTRLPWITIDPMPFAGPPEFGIAQLLWRVLDKVESPNQLQDAFDILVTTAQLDTQKSRDWTVVRIIDYWLWALEHGLTEDPVRCQTVLDWLDLVP